MNSNDHINILRSYIIFYFHQRIILEFFICKQTSFCIIHALTFPLFTYPHHGGAFSDSLLLIYNLSAHPWVREDGDASEIPLDISILNNIREFVKYSRLKQIALRVNTVFQKKLIFYTGFIELVRQQHKLACFTSNI